MAIQTFDLALQLVAPGAAVVATASSTGVLLYPRLLPTCDWVVYASAVLGTGTYTFTLEESDVVGGSYTAIANLVWPPALAAGKINVAINANKAGFLDSDAKFLRVTATLGGTPSIIYGSFLAKAANKAGIAARVGDIVTVS